MRIHSLGLRHSAESIKRFAKHASHFFILYRKQFDDPWQVVSHEQPVLAISVRQSCMEIPMQIKRCARLYVLKENPSQDGLQRTNITMLRCLYAQIRKRQHRTSQRALRPIGGSCHPRKRKNQGFNPGLLYLVSNLVLLRPPQSKYPVPAR